MLSPGTMAVLGRKDKKSFMQRREAEIFIKGARHQVNILLQGIPQLADSQYVFRDITLNIPNYQSVILDSIRVYHPYVNRVSGASEPIGFAAMLITGVDGNPYPVVSGLTHPGETSVVEPTTVRLGFSNLWNIDNLDIKFLQKDPAFTLQLIQTPRFELTDTSVNCSLFLTFYELIKQIILV
jgi:hypothetical protein